MRFGPTVSLRARQLVSAFLSAASFGLLTLVVPGDARSHDVLSPLMVYPALLAPQLARPWDPAVSGLAGLGQWWLGIGLGACVAGVGLELHAPANSAMGWILAALAAIAVAVAIGGRLGRVMFVLALLAWVGTPVGAPVRAGFSFAIVVLTCAVAAGHRSERALRGAAFASLLAGWTSPWGAGAMAVSVLSAAAVRVQPTVWSRNPGGVWARLSETMHTPSVQLLTVHRDDGRWTLRAPRCVTLIGMVGARQELVAFPEKVVEAPLPPRGARLRLRSGDQDVDLEFQPVGACDRFMEEGDARGFLTIVMVTAAALFIHGLVSV